jgi:hypothetical protein
MSEQPTRAQSAARPALLAWPGNPRRGAMFAPRLAPAHRMLERIVVLSLVRSVAVLMALLAATRAFAQPAPGPPSDDHRTVNIASNPFSWFVGLYGLGVSVALHDRIALHADTNYLDSQSGASTTKGYELGLGVTLYARRAFSGLLIEPGVRFRRVFEHCKGCGDFDGADLHSRTTTVGPELLVGWHWMIDDHLNVAVAFGLLYNVNHHAMLFSANGEPLDSAIEPDGYVRIGFAL